MINSRFRILFIQTTRILIPGILFSMYLLTGCRNDPKEIDALVNKGNMQEDKATDVTMLFSENGHVKAKIYTKEFVKNEVAKPPYTDMRKGVNVDFYNDSLGIESTLTARYARYYDKQGNVLVRDSVVMVNKKGERLNTEELVWNQSIRKIFTEKFVRITTPTQIMYGDGLEANEDFSWYRIIHPKGIVQVNKTDVP